MATAQVAARDNESHPPARYVVASTVEDAQAYAKKAGHTEAKAIAIYEALKWPLDPGDVVVAIKGQGDPSEPWVALGKRAQSIGAIVKGR